MQPPKPNTLPPTFGATDDGADAPQVTATLLFADICGSTRLFEQYGDLKARQIEMAVLVLLAEKTEKFEGIVVKTIGDEIMSRFPTADVGVRAACEMHSAIKEDADLAKWRIAIRIGLHHGPVLEIGKDDVVGDAVNVAARMSALAKADQIFTTRDTITHLCSELQLITRSLGQSWVKGKQDEIETWEVIWNDKNLTKIQSVNPEFQEKLRHFLSSPQLKIEFRGQTFTLRHDDQNFTLGRDDRSKLRMDKELVSRNHAYIEPRQGKFILVDQSTNGTYVALENGSRFFVRREQFTLHDRGMICLGQAITNEENPDVIRYECVYS